MRKREKTKGDPEFLGWAMEGMALSCTEMREAAGAKVGDNTVRSSVLDMSAFEVPVRPPSRDIQVGTFLKKIPIPPHLNQRKKSLFAIDATLQQSFSQGFVASIRCLPPGSLCVDVTSGGKQNTCTIGLTGEGELLPEVILLFFFTKSMAVFWQPGSYMYMRGKKMQSLKIQMHR